MIELLVAPQSNLWLCESERSATGRNCVSSLGCGLDIRYDAARNGDFQGRGKPVHREELFWELIARILDHRNHILEVFEQEELYKTKEELSKDDWMSLQVDIPTKRRAKRPVNKRGPKPSKNKVAANSKSNKVLLNVMFKGYEVLEKSLHSRKLEKKITGKGKFESFLGFESTPAARLYLETQYSNRQGYRSVNAPILDRATARALVAGGLGGVYVGFWFTVYQTPKGIFSPLLFRSSLLVLPPVSVNSGNHKFNVILKLRVPSVSVSESRRTNHDSVLPQYRYRGPCMPRSDEHGMFAILEQYQTETSRDMAFLNLRRIGIRESGNNYELQGFYSSTNQSVEIRRNYNAPVLFKKIAGPDQLSNEHDWDDDRYRRYVIELVDRLPRVFEKYSEYQQCSEVDCSSKIPRVTKSELKQLRNVTFWNSYEKPADVLKTDIFFNHLE